MRDEATKLVNDLHQKIYDALSANACHECDVDAREKAMNVSLAALALYIEALEKKADENEEKYDDLLGDYHDECEMHEDM